MDWASVVVGYLSDAFLDPVRQGFPAPSVLQGVVFTGASFVIGWMASRSGSQRRQRARVVSELILSQRELKSRAFPKVWRKNDPREAWMLEPFVARLRFLHDSLTESKSLTGRQLTLIDYYILRVEEFIERWSVAKIKNVSYRSSYDVTYKALRAAARALKIDDSRRFQGLETPNDELFGPPPSASAPAMPLAPQGLEGGLVPAE